MKAPILALLLAVLFAPDQSFAFGGGGFLGMGGKRNKDESSTQMIKVTYDLSASTKEEGGVIAEIEDSDDCEDYAEHLNQIKIKSGSGKISFRCESEGEDSVNHIYMDFEVPALNEGEAAEVTFSTGTSSPMYMCKGMKTNKGVVTLPALKKLVTSDHQSEIPEGYSVGVGSIKCSTRGKTYKDGQVGVTSGSIKYARSIDESELEE